MRHQSNNDCRPAGHAGGFLHRRGSNAARSRPTTLPCLLRAVAIASGTLLAGATSAHAQLRVEGEPDAVHIEARDVSLREVLEALHEKFHLRYRPDDALDNRLTGTFNGPLRRVAARILDGYDFAIKVTPQGIDVLVLREQKPSDKPVVAAMAATATSRKSPAPVMTAQEANRYERGHGR
jgi:hypothetical protein